MSSENTHTLANSETPIPVVQIHPAESPGGRTPSTGNGSHRLSATKLKDKLESLGDNMSRESSSRMGDRMINLLLAQVLPGEDPSSTSPPEGSANPTPQIKDRRSRSYVERPNFSLPTMSSNFRRFNSRIGVAFVFQNRLIHLFTWKQPTQTLSFLFMYTFICIDPYLLPVIPLACCLFFIMVPSYLTRHPPPPTSFPTDLYPLGGPALADAPTIKPAPEFSKDFFRNMRDLQNCMEDFSRGHDAVLQFLTPLTNFSNENLSSLLYIILLLSSCALFLASHLLPWRAIFLVLGYTLTATGHPAIADLLATPENDARLAAAEHDARSLLLSASKSDIELQTTQPPREVEIFELQHRPLHTPAAEFAPFLFSHSPYAPLSPARISGDRPRGAAFFEDVLPPRGWRWGDKKWGLDLLSREWVDERCVTGVEVEIEGERWVTDLHYEVLGDEEGGYSREGKGGVGEQEREVLRRAWEVGRPSRRGEWRRRRWVRMVERVGSV
ncbi:integral peroxisomal membrane peroxin-domain-containing protein [Boeremia exigua]|uniref:integral peroxisomal membrane peroxin-domain-containing protein n=1 Tax=Boeremia exigua TaxID=749465 RepID=UPI001E8DB7BF|nr:integral peroxisomal membrane peroxin-domain-containing protein [Boeremia exigua]KAH6625137.1 integral peroxisomal membrane peroxin-domain-containing protein [Boeremia exigua]